MISVLRGGAVLALAVLWLSGCSILQEFAPAVQVHSLSPGEAIELRRGDILTRGEISDATQQTIRVAALDDGTCATPTALACLNGLADEAGLSTDRRLAALAELWLAQAQTLRAGPRQQAAWLETIRYAYAYLFFGDSTPGERAFENRQTQVSDWYNYAVEQVVTGGFVMRKQEVRDGVCEFNASSAGWDVQTDLGGMRLPGEKGLPAELLPASSLSFAGLRSLYRRDGFGAELVAIMPEQPLAVTPGLKGRPGVKGKRQPQPWSEMPAPSLTVLLHPQGDDLETVLQTYGIRVTAHDPYVESTVQLHGQSVPLAANFTAGYGMWLARSGFNRQSLLSLFGREGGIDRPHVYLMQPYDPNRRIIVMLHGLASSPEAWVELSNEILGDEDLRHHYQIWQVYYPTSMPVALNNTLIRRALRQTLEHFDPAGEVVASSDLVILGHSMGGVISRLMVSSSSEELRQMGADRVQQDPRQTKRLDSVLRFDPVPQISRAIFIAAPHQGTPIAGGRLGLWLSSLIRLPLTAVEEISHLLLPSAEADGHERVRAMPNSINNLNANDPFVQVASRLQISPEVAYHSIIAQADPAVPLLESSDGLVPYRSAHLPDAQSEKVLFSGHSVQQTAAAILEIQRILKEDIRQREDGLVAGDVASTSKSSPEF